MELVLYAAKCYWPGVREAEVASAATRADVDGVDATFRGALYLPEDEVVLGLFEAPSRASVKDASERAGMPCERVIETVFVAPSRREAVWKGPRKAEKRGDPS